MNRVGGRREGGGRDRWRAGRREGGKGVGSE